MKINENVTWKTLGEKVVAVKVETGEYYTMNEVSATIWKSIDEGLDADQIAEKIMSEYDNENKPSVLNDIKEQLSEWEQESLIL